MCKAYILLLAFLNLTFCKSNRDFMKILQSLSQNFPVLAWRYFTKGEKGASNATNGEINC